MAKKFVRGITDVKTITNQCYDTNNVNDLLSDGQYNYIHRKKGKNEEYHNLTDNIKTLSSDNTELLSVTNNNKTTNTATLHPKHDAQKEQLLESTRDTITINHGTNGTAEKTTVDTNPQKVLEHENLISNSQYVTIEHEEDSNTSEIKTDKLNNTINELNSKIETVDEKIPTIIGGRNYLRGTSDKYQTFTSDSYILGPASTDHDWPKLLAPLRGKTVTLRAYIKNDTDYPVRILMWFTGGGVIGNKVAPHNEGWSVGTGKMSADWTSANVAFTQTDDNATGGTIQAKEAKLEIGSIPSDWSPAPEDVNTLIAQKQDKLTAGEGITIQGNTISAIDSSTSTIRYFPDTNFKAYEHLVQTSDGYSLITFSFECYNAAETVLTGDLKQRLNPYVKTNTSISNGAVTITNDGTNMKLINSAPSENIWQNGTFTFIRSTGGGGGDFHPAS